MLRQSLIVGALAACVVLVGCAPRVPEAPDRVSYPGFDTWQYPGAEVLASWRDEAPYEWIGYYLPSPCHRGRTWEGRRSEIEGMGFGIAVLYVGQQTWDGVADPEEPPDVIICSRTLLDAENGRRDGRDAVETMRAEGFPTGSVIYLNVERMERVTSAMAEYYAAWQQTVLEDGRVVPGTYAHMSNSDPLFAVARQVFEQQNTTTLPPFWNAGGTALSLESAPTDAGRPYAKIWQGILDVQRTWAGHELLIDENVASVRNPSAPRGAPPAGQSSGP